MKAPCQTIVWYLLPALGAELARELAKRKMPQNEIAKRLGVTPAAVSHYINGSRGSEVTLGKKSIAEIRRLAGEIAKGKPDERKVMRAVCGICRIAWSEKALCSIHLEKGTCVSCSDGKMRCR